MFPHKNVTLYPFIFWDGGTVRVFFITYLQIPLIFGSLILIIVLYSGFVQQDYQVMLPLKSAKFFFSSTSCLFWSNIRQNLDTVA